MPARGYRPAPSCAGRAGGVPDQGSLRKARTSGRRSPRNSRSPNAATNMASTGSRLSSSNGTSGTVRLASPSAETARRLLALEDQGRGEDRVGEQRHDHDAHEGDRRLDRLVDDEAEAEPDAGQDQQGIDEEEAEARRASGGGSGAWRGIVPRDGY